MPTQLYTAEEVLESPCVHFYLKDTIRTFLEKDPLDALNDAELLVKIMRQRFERYL